MYLIRLNAQNDTLTSVYHTASGLRKTGRRQQVWTSSSDSAESETLSQPEPWFRLKCTQTLYCNAVQHLRWHYSFIFTNDTFLSQRSRTHNCQSSMDILV